VLCSKKAQHTTTCKNNGGSAHLIKVRAIKPKIKSQPAFVFSKQL